MPFEIYLGESALDAGDITMLWLGDKSGAGLSALREQGALSNSLFLTQKDARWSHGVAGAVLQMAQPKINRLLGMIRAFHQVSVSNSYFVPGLCQAASQMFGNYNRAMPAACASDGDREISFSFRCVAWQ